MNALYELNEKFETVTTELFSAIEDCSDNAYIDEMRDEVRFTKGLIGVVVYGQSSDDMTAYVYSDKRDGGEESAVKPSELKEFIVNAFNNF